MGEIGFKKFGKWMWLLVGHVFVVLGAVGIFLPLLPTTPFLLLAALCYSRGSHYFETWLKNHRILGPPIALWRQHGVIGLKAKILASVMIGLSVLWVGFRPDIPSPGKGAMIVTVTCVLVFLWTRPSRIS